MDLKNDWHALHLQFLAITADQFSVLDEGTGAALASLEGTLDDLEEVVASQHEEQDCEEGEDCETLHILQLRLENVVAQIRVLTRLAHQYQHNCEERHAALTEGQEEADAGRMVDQALDPPRPPSKPS